MTSLNLAVLQLTGDIDPLVNARAVEAAVADAAGRGATLLCTPEMTNLLDRDRARAAARITTVEDDPVVAATRAAAARHGIAVALGSVAVRDTGSDRLANRSLLIDGHGGIVAAYDKMHLFDVALGGADDWRESAAYAPGAGPVVARVGDVRLGLSICYDLRFPALYQALSGAGAEVLLVPAAFTRPTGHAHWRTLLRARAIENAAFVVAAAQTGEHPDGRATWGHSLVIDPWGEVLLDLGKDPALGFATLSLDRVADARGRIDVLAHRRAIGAVEEHPPLILQARSPTPTPGAPVAQPDRAPDS